jgi:hypothetical protein
MRSGGLRGLKSHRQGNTLQDTEKKLQFCNHYKKRLTKTFFFDIMTMEADWKRYRKRYRKTLSVFRHFPAKPFIFMPLFITEGVWL